MTKLLNYCEVFSNHFNYRHQVYDNKNWRHSHISVEITWDTKYWPDRYHVYFLVLAEFNANYLQGYLVDGVNVEPQLDFWCQLVWEMVENTTNEETEARYVDVRRLRARKGTLGDHEIVIAPKYCEK